MVREAAAKPAAVAPLGRRCFVELRLVFFFSRFLLELAAGARGLEDEGEGATGGSGGRGGGLFDCRLVVVFFFRGEGRRERR